MFSLLPSRSFHPMLDVVDTAPQVPGVVPAPPALFFLSRMLFDMHCIYCRRQEYREVLSEDHKFRNRLWGEVLDKTLGSFPALQVAAQIILIMRRAIEVSKKVHAVYIEWDKLVIIWMSPYPVDSSPPPTQKTEMEFLCEQVSWKISTLYAQIVPLAWALWELSISYRLLIKAFGTTAKARSKAVKTLFVNLAEHEKLLVELRDNEPLVGKILTFFHINTPAKKWITQLDETVKTLRKVNTITTTGITAAGNMTTTVYYRARMVLKTFLKPPSSA